MDAERRRVPKRTKIKAIMRPNVQLKYGPNKKYNGNYRRWVESRIFERTLPQHLMTNANTMKEHKLYNHALNVFETDI